MDRNNVVVTCNSIGQCAIVVRFHYVTKGGKHRVKTQTSFSPHQAMVKLNRSRLDLDIRENVQVYDEVYGKLITLESMTVLDGVCLTPLQFAELYGEYPFEVTKSIWLAFPYRFKEIKRDIS